MTHTLPLSEVKINLSKLVDGVVRKDDEIIITRNGKPAAVLMSVQEHDSWRETQEILASPALVREIQVGLDAIQKGKAKKYSVEEIFGPETE